MRIGVDISQLAYQNTGVANYLYNLLDVILKSDNANEYVLFYSSFRKKFDEIKLKKQHYGSNVKIVKSKLPPIMLNLMWNKLHIFPIENLIGEVDIFVTSDWSEPPTRKAKKATIIYDLIVYKYPDETHNRTDFNLKNFILKSNIVSIQKEKLEWVKKESDIIFCISNSTKKDAIQILGLDPKKVEVIYPGLTI